MMDTHEHEATVIKVVTIIALGVIVETSVISITIVAIMTDRNTARAEALTFGGAVLLAALGGVSWFALQRRPWRVRLEPGDEPEA